MGKYNTRSLHDLCWLLRGKGYSYAEIAEIAGCSKSLAYYHCHGVVLSEKAQARIAKKQSDSASASNKKRAGTGWISPLGLENLKANAIKNGEAARKKFGTEYFTDKMNLAYQKHELPIKSALEAIFNQEFHKEKCGTRFFDFASEDFLIEHTSASSGTQLIIERFTLAQQVGDLRDRIAILKWASPIQHSILRCDLNVAIIDATKFKLLLHN